MAEGLMVARSSVRFDPIARDIALIIDEDLSLEAQGRKLADAAQEALIDAQGVNQRALGYVPDHDTYVDGAKRADLASVRGGSVITFEFHLLVDVIQWVDEQLILHSPVKSERYARSHIWFADEIEFDPLIPVPAEEYIVLSSVPYARKIERGQSQQAPEGVYEAVATLAKRRFGNIAYVGFSYRSFPGGAVGKWAGSATAAKLARDVRGGNPKGHADWLTRQPCIKIDPGQ